MRKMVTSDSLYISFPIVWDEDFVKELSVTLYNPNRWGWERFWRDVEQETKKRPFLVIAPCVIRAIIWSIFHK